MSLVNGFMETNDYRRTAIVAVAEYAFRKCSIDTIDISLRGKTWELLEQAYLFREAAIDTNTFTERIQQYVSEVGLESAESCINELKKAHSMNSQEIKKLKKDTSFEIRTYEVHESTYNIEKHLIQIIQANFPTRS